MKLTHIILASLLFLGGCSVNSVKDQQLLLIVPDSLMEEPAEPKTLTPEAETPKVAPWRLFG